MAKHFPQHLFPASSPIYQYIFQNGSMRRIEIKQSTTGFLKTGWNCLPTSMPPWLLQPFRISTGSGGLCRHIHREGKGSKKFHISSRIHLRLLKSIYSCGQDLLCPNNQLQLQEGIFFTTPFFLDGTTPWFLHWHCCNPIFSNGLTNMYLNHVFMAAFAV